MEWRIVHQSVGAQMGKCAHRRLNYSGDSNYDLSVKASISVRLSEIRGLWIACIF